MKEVQALLESRGLDPSFLRVLYRRERTAILGLTVEGGGEAAHEVLSRLERAPEQGLWPVIVGREGEEELPARLEWRSQTAQQLLAEAEGIDFPAWVEQEHADLIVRSRKELAEAEQAGDEEAVSHLRKELNRRAPWQCLRRAEWPAEAGPGESWMVGHSLTHDEDGDDVPVTLALVPARSGWEALAVLNFGSQWRATRQAVHIAAFRHWEQAYGAEVVCVTSDTIEAWVARPPRSRKKALELARAQCLYCPDLETQIYKSVDALAARLLRGEAWYFWWD
jgi:Domain of unknown function (DUF4253)